jgi:hypothetical protein
MDTNYIKVKLRFLTYLHELEVFLSKWDCMKMDLREIGWDGVDWVDLAQDRDHWRALVNTVMNLRVP